MARKGICSYWKKKIKWDIFKYYKKQRYNFLVLSYIIKYNKIISYGKGPVVIQNSNSRE